VKLAKKSLKVLDENLYEAAFLVAGGSVLASMILSDILDYLPCTLCWYQRIFMFPLPFILGAVVLRKDKLGYLYVLPLTFVGALIALYQYLLQFGVIVHESATCSITGSSCAEPQIQILGFMTIPFGSLAAFAIISALVVRAKYKKNAKLPSDKEQQQKLSKMLLFLLVATIAAVGITKTVQ